jgi:hypothetical protein
LVSHNDFLFGAQSALQYEEFNVLKTNRHKIRQKRVLVIDGHQIYHQKQLIDPKSGMEYQPSNNLPNVQQCLVDENGNYLMDDSLSQSQYSQSGSKKTKKVGYYKAKMSNIFKTGIFGGKSKKNLRMVQNIIQIHQLAGEGNI